MILRLLALFAATALFAACTPSTNTPSEPPAVRTGAQVMISDMADDLAGRNIGLVMNPTARIYGTHVLDSLMSLGINVVALYAPEHGFRGDYGAGERISDGIDEETGLPVFSLYGETRKPSETMLEGVDLLLFDMQDVGARFYTYLSTMGLVMEAAADYDVEMWILDRPNPAGGEYVSGWMREDEHTSFVGAYPIPIAHGMTLGELAHMIVGEGWLELTNPAAQLNYRVIPMQHWDRSMLWPQTGLPWVPPSPNLPTFEHAFVYLGTCLIEGTTMSEGRGTDDPFLLIGAPDLNIPDTALQTLATRYSLTIRDTTFTPVEIPGRALRPKHQDTQVSGIYIRVQDDHFSTVNPVAFGHALLRLSLQHSPSSTTNNFLKRLAGTDRILDYLQTDVDAVYMWTAEVEAFKTLRQAYLIY
ncbi:MAG: DUF1343 domain-containing protein [Balneolales bacterium]|nr:DUF1343 domain-containing protein [Balneolales bacterium]